MSDVRINLLKEVKSAVNTASFAPTDERIADAKRQVSRLMSYVESLEEGLKTGKELFEELSEQMERQGGESLTPAPKPKRKVSKKPRKQKSSKATSATRIADRQERAFHGKADTPVTPRHTKRTASVEEARKAAQEVSDKSGATARAKRKAEALKDAVTKELGSEMQVTQLNNETNTRIYTFGSPEERMAELEARVEALIALQSMGHDVMRNENEVLFSDLPFDPDFNHYEG